MDRIDFRLVWLRSAVFTALFLALWGAIGGQGVVGQDLEELFGRSGLGQNLQEGVSIDAQFLVDERTGRGQLRIAVEIPDGWHLYSITQQPGGPQRSVIKVPESASYQITGNFEPDAPPVVQHDDPYFPVPVEYHSDFVTWTAPIRLAQGVDPQQLKIPIEFTGQICKVSCTPINEKLTATFGGFLQSVAVGSSKFSTNSGHVLWHGTVNAGGIGAGRTVIVSITAEPQEPFYIYRYSDKPVADEAWKPTLIVFSNLEDLTVSAPETEGVLTAHPTLGDAIQYHKSPVTWTFRITAPAKIEKPGDRIIRGTVGFMSCTDGQCDPPGAIAFEFDLTVGQDIVEPSTIRFAHRGDYIDIVRSFMTAQGPRIADAGAWRDYPAPLVVGLAFLAGLILNIMPCVLPVIGIKVMSFVSQSGASPGRLILLNVVFSLGIVAVFLVLATLAVFFGYGWGELYKNNTFTIIMVSVLFVFALSFLGVWEIPLPGFVGTAGGSVQQQEGLLAAFVKGNFTTILATPCSGPLLVPAVVWAVAQPVWVTYLVFAAMGLGMAFPYLVIGAVPRLAKMLPRPGEWMQTFKVLMGFALLGAVVFFFGSVTEKYAMPTLAFLVFLGMACWWIGRIHLTAELPEKLSGWGRGLGIVALGAFVAFYVLIPRHELPWEPYSRALMERYLAEGRPVFIDATADWCATCKLNESVALNRGVTKTYFASHNIVPLKADNTENSAEINALLDGLGNTTHGLPYYVLILPDRPDDPLHFGGVTFLRAEDFLKRIRPLMDARRGEVHTAAGGALDWDSTSSAK